jgi:hypothetical protein
VKRRKPLKRGRPLRGDPEKVREFLQRGRKAELKRSKLKARPKREAPVEGPLTPEEWRRAVFVASGGRCVISGSVARDAEDRGFQAHHALPARELRARGLRDRVWDSRNGVWLARRVHERHESAVERVPRSALPASVWEFCRELDRLDGTEWATQLVLRLHPARVAGDTHKVP